MRNALLTAFVLLAAGPAFAAEEPSGCDKFKWPIEHERAALTAPDRVKLASGADLAAIPATGMTFALVTLADAKLPTQMTRAKGRHLRRLRELQGRAEGQHLPRSACRRAPGSCAPGRTRPEAEGFQRRDRLRRYSQDHEAEISASPFVLQISGARDNALSVAIMPSE